MQAHGSDRMREVAGGRILLFSRYPKEWQTRVEKTRTSPEHPGMAIFWDDVIYEVVSAEMQQQGGVRYVLEPWRDEHAIRVSDRYDAETEAFRAEEHRKRIARETKRKTATAMGFLAGYLPALVQHEMAGELGLFAHRMTVLSTLPVFAVIAGMCAFMVHQYKDGGGVPTWELLLTVFLIAENMIRWITAWTQNRPMGSVLGVLLYSIVWAAGRRKGISPLKQGKGNALYIREEAVDTKLRDAFIVREPLVTLLSPAEQARFAERFDYDYRRHSFKVAAIFLAFSLAGVYTSLHQLNARPSFIAFISLVCAGGIAIEQILRLASFKRGPAGSILAALARPFTRSLIG